MKNYSRRILIITVGLILAILGAMLTHSIAVQSSLPAFDARASFFLQTTATPLPVEEADRSEIGSTDGIVVLGVIIVLIVSIPIMVRRKHWMRQPPA